jgi:alkanesulfonate monooxygenase SsuD/methylene tetrahydromethanopterin reductase-like flavin-dependent oxidoreductase (luciferase family)
VELGAHLPLRNPDGSQPTVATLREYTRTARDLGFETLAIDALLLGTRDRTGAPAALAAVLAESDPMRLVTTLARPLVDGPDDTAHWLAAVDRLSGGRVIAGVGTGAPADTSAAGVAWGARWSRLDEAVALMRALWRGERLEGAHYASDGARRAVAGRRAGPPVWIGSRGSLAGLRLAARSGDGWLASAVRVTPARFAADWRALRRQLDALGRDDTRFRNGVGALWTYVTDDAREAGRVLEHVLAPALGADPAALRARTLVGSAAECAAILDAYACAGAQRVFLRPVADPVAQLERVREQVAPLLTPPAPQPPLEAVGEAASA